MKPQFSEFSYGFAITAELIDAPSAPGITAAPAFPSLYAEGQTGVGYDVAIQGGIPLLLQFKLSHILTTSRAGEANKLGLPYFRFDLQPPAYSNQHASLLSLEQQGNQVFYCAPAFHKEIEFNHTYMQRQVCDSSIWIPPSQIGAIDDGDEHRIAFKNATASEFFLCSKPQRRRGKFSFQDATANIMNSLRSRESEDDELTGLGKIGQIIDMLQGIAERQSLFASEMLDEEWLKKLGPVRQAAVLAQLVCDARLYMVRQNG